MGALVVNTMMQQACRLTTRAAPASIRYASTITGIRAREIIDSRGNPTVEVDLTTSGGSFRASVPSGASTGIYEASELRDGGKRYMGKGVLQAVENCNGVMAERLLGMNVTDQRAIDNAMIELDGTENKSKLGANAILGISLAASKAGAAANGLELYQHYAQLAGNPHATTLPVPCFNVINGGSHAGNRLAFQEYFVIPSNAASFSEAMAIGCEVYHHLAQILKKKFGGDATLIGDEGGFAPPCEARSGLELIMEAITAAGHDGKCTVGLDVASSEFKVKPGPNGEGAMYDLDFKTTAAEKDPALMLKASELHDLYAELIRDFPIVTVEDPFDEDDWPNWSQIVADQGRQVQIVGDDLTVTNPKKIQRAVEEKSANCLLLKVNQIGTISESIDAVKLSKQNGWGVMTSHRSGETEDTYIADIAVGLCTGQIKTGAPCRSERLAKYNQLLRIEAQLGASAIYPGSNFRKTAWMA